MSTECDKLLIVVRQIWQVCRRSSSQHPKGSHAYTHFMADFDEIRGLCKPFVAGQDSDETTK